MQMRQCEQRTYKQLNARVMDALLKQIIHTQNNTKHDRYVYQIDLNCSTQ